MGSIYKVANKWRVTIRRKGFKSISSYFNDYDKAKAFHDLAEERIKTARDNAKIDKALEKIHSR